jgi:hypothetical protein
MPQVNEEYGYEDHYPRWGGNRKWPARTADNRRRLAWTMVMAGGYQTTGERANTGTGWGADTGGGWINGRGDDSMVMLQGYGYMVDFFTSIPWWTLNPDDDLIRQPDRPAVTPEPTHIIYTRDKQGHATLYLAGQPIAARRYRATYRTGTQVFVSLWRTGEWRPTVAGRYHAVAVYDSVLTAKEVADRFRAGLTGNRGASSSAAIHLPRRPG